MTPHEKAVNAINARLERLQVNLRDAKVESAQRFLFQSLVVTIAIAEALNDYIRMVGQYAQRRHGEIKQTNEALSAQHAELLKSGQNLLEKLKASPSDRAVRKEIEGVQQKMAGVQKTLRRGANALQRELAPSLALIDQMSVSVRRFSEADQGDELKRVLKTVVSQVHELYANASAGPGKSLFDAASWEQSALSEVEQAADFYDAYARAGYQVVLALELMTLAVSENPGVTREEATQRVHDAVTSRIKEVTARFAAS